jgi:hypothetical protein
MARNARFWVWYSPGESYVKLTLAPGKSIAWESGGPHEEGWSREGESYEWDGEILESESWSDGVDCDGRLSTHRSHVCPGDRLQIHPGHEDLDVLLPDWVTESSGQRDYAAEAAGY